MKNDSSTGYSFGFSEQQHINICTTNTQCHGIRIRIKIDNQHNLKEQKEGAEFLSKVLLLFISIIHVLFFYYIFLTLTFEELIRYFKNVCGSVLLWFE